VPSGPAVRPVSRSQVRTASTRRLSSGIVVTLVGRDDTWDATLADGQKVLDSLTFTSGTAEPDASAASGRAVTIPEPLLGTWAADVEGTTATSGNWLLKAESGN
jgi:hypothetical protein